MFKLESFARPAIGAEFSETRYCRDDVDQAYADGYATGRSDATEAQIEDLHRALAALSAVMAEDDARRNALRQEAVDALLPVLEQIIDLMAPVEISRRIEETLADELRRLAHGAAPVHAQILCGPSLRGLVRESLKAHDLHRIQIIDIDEPVIRIRLEGGRIEIAPEQVAKNIAAVIAAAREEG
ncbi:MAG: hypothetical protein P3W94_001000 [Paracoccus sp. (in: a-proteobacteria)]|nr:hypothetical protein [Paracoccus sp. (in: a-proteobacteria)]